jgi:phage-related protein
MAANALTFSLFGKDVSAGKAIKGVADTAERAGGAFKGMASVAGGALAAMGVSAGLNSVKQFLGDSVTAYKEAETSQLQLTTAYEKFPAMGSLAIDTLRSLNTELAAKTRFDDDALASGQALLGQFGLTGQQVADLTPLMADYAARTGKDIPSAADDLGKAMLGQGRALKGIGLDFKDAGSVGANFTQVMEGLNAQVGGFAEKDGAAGAGMAMRLKNQIGELQEKIGSGLLPIIYQMQGAFLTYVIPVLSRVADAFANNVGPAFASFLAFMTPVVAAVRDLLGPILATLGPQILGVAMAFSPLQMVLGALQPVLPLLATLLQTVGGILSGVLTAALPVITSLAGQLATTLSGALGAILPVVAALLSQVGDAVTSLLPTIVMLASVLGGAIMGLFSALVPVIAALLPVVSRLIAVIVPLAAVLLEQVGGAIEAIMPTVLELAGVLGDVLMSIFAALGPVIATLLPVVGMLLQALMPLIEPIMSIVMAFLPLVSILGELIGALLPPLMQILMAVLEPIIGLVTVLVGLLAPILQFVAELISTLVGWLAQWVQFLIGILVPVLTMLAGVVRAVFEGIADFVGDVFKNVARFVAGGINTIIDLVNGAIGGINDMGKAAASVTGGAITWHIDKLPKIPALAMGGIVSSATLAMIGEGSEPEVVAPLSKLPGLMQQSGYGGSGSSGPTVLEFHGDASALAQLFTIHERKADGTRVLVSKMGKQRGR